MTKKAICYILANFGGPRHLDEVRPFLEELLTDQDVVRTRLPKVIHNLIFRRIAQKRAIKVSKDYQLIGGKSPIYKDTETLASMLGEMIQAPTIAFHRYLPATHRDFIQALADLPCDEFKIFPMFPQFTYATTGSIARWFDKHLPKEIVSKMRWIKSYPSHLGFIHAYQNNIRDFLEANKLNENDCFLLFSAHGIPRRFVEDGDPYEQECCSSYQLIAAGFPKAASILAFQSKFGPGEWLRPYTIEVCQDIKEWSGAKKHVIVVPLAFTSDHIETLFEIEEQYLPLIRLEGLEAYRLPALNVRSDWINGITSILQSEKSCPNQELIRRKNRMAGLSFLPVYK